MFALACGGELRRGRALQETRCERVALWKQSRGGGVGCVLAVSWRVQSERGRELPVPQAGGALQGQGAVLGRCAGAADVGLQPLPLATVL